MKQKHKNLKKILHVLPNEFSILGYYLSMNEFAQQSNDDGVYIIYAILNPEIQTTS
jgi:hypothetical protein